jgi:hypothetical protein
VRHRRALFPGFSDIAEFEPVCPDMRLVKKAFSGGAARVTVPRGSGKLTIEARLLYRKADQYLLNFMFGPDSGLTSPITEISSATRVVRVEAPGAREPARETP